MTNETVSALYSEPHPELLRVATWYWYVHPYISLVVCLFGITTNIINILILTRKELRSSINCVLSGIAISDLCLMLCYMPFVIHFYIESDLTPSPQKYSLGWTRFLMFHGNFTAVLHTTSIWLAVYLAVYRYYFLRSPSPRNKCFKFRSTCLVIPATLVMSALIMCPNYIITQVEQKEISPNQTLYRLKDMGIGTSNPNPTALAMFWIYGTAGKIIPSVLIAIFGGMLLNTLVDVKQRTDSLKSCLGGQRSHQHHRTTMMLLIIIVMYLITELPQGIMVLISCYTEGFFQNVYMPLGDIMDIIALVNNSVNFILYCSMSQKFRKSFLEMMPKHEAKGYTAEFELITQTGTRMHTV